MTCKYSRQRHANLSRQVINTRLLLIVSLISMVIILCSTTSAQSGRVMITVQPTGQPLPSNDIAPPFARTMICPANYVATKVIYKDGDPSWSDPATGATLICQKMNIDATLWESIELNNPDFSRSSRNKDGPDCPSGAVLVGIRTGDASAGGYSDWMDAIAPVCRMYSSSGSGLTWGTISRPSNADMHGDYAIYEVLCPEGQAVTGLYTKDTSIPQGSVVDGATISCSGFSQSPAVGSAQLLPEYGGDTLDPTERATCNATPAGTAQGFRFSRVSHTGFRFDYPANISNLFDCTGKCEEGDNVSCTAYSVGQGSSLPPASAPCEPVCSLDAYLGCQGVTYPSLSATSPFVKVTASCYPGIHKLNTGHDVVCARKELNSAESPFIPLECCGECAGNDTPTKSDFVSAGAQVPVSATFITNMTADANASQPIKSIINAKVGAVMVTLKPAWNAADGYEYRLFHYVLDDKNWILLQKTSDGKMRCEYTSNNVITDADALLNIQGWTSNSVHKVLMQWDGINKFLRCKVDDDVPIEKSLVSAIASGAVSQPPTVTIYESSLQSATSQVSNNDITSPFSQTVPCPSGYVATGVAYRDDIGGNWDPAKGVTLICRWLNANSTLGDLVRAANPDMARSTPDRESSAECASGVLAGIHYAEQYDWLDAALPICQDYTPSASGPTLGARKAPAETPDSIQDSAFYDPACPEGEIVTGLFSKDMPNPPSGPVVDGVTVSCSRIVTTQRIIINSSPAQTTPGSVVFGGSINGGMPARAKMDLILWSNPDPKIAYCTMNSTWVYRILDKVTCGKARLGWTGSACCGEFNDRPEFYNDPAKNDITLYDPAIKGACWNSTVLTNGLKATGTNSKVLILSGSLFGCNMSQPDPLLSLRDTIHPQSPLILPVPICTLAHDINENPYFNLYCSLKNGTWASAKSNKNLTISANPTNPNDTECCAKNLNCWDGTTCIDDQSLESEPKTTNGYRCIKGAWVEAILKLTPDLSGTGFCPQKTDCLINPRGLPINNYQPDKCFSPTSMTSIRPVCSPDGPACLADGQYFVDDLCIEGNWTSRTKAIALELLNTAESDSPSDYALFCGEYMDVLNTLPDTVIGSYSLEHYLGQTCEKNGMTIPCVNQLCALRYAGSRIAFGTSLNIPIDSEKSFLTALELDKNACNNAAIDDGRFHPCTNDVSYNHALQAVLVKPGLSSPTGAAIAPPTSKPILNRSKEPILHTFLTALQTFAKANPDRKIFLDPLANATRFDNLFIMKGQGRSFFGELEKNIYFTFQPNSAQFKEPYDIVFIVYTGINITDPITSKAACDMVSDKVQPTTLKAFTCEYSPNDKAMRMLAIERVTETPLRTFWKDLTSKLR